MIVSAYTGSNGSGYIGGNGTGGYGMEVQSGSSQYGLSFGGGRASGGSTVGGTLYEVAEGGRPELYQSGGRTYLLSGQNGNVVPAGRGGAAVSSGSGSVAVYQTITVDGKGNASDQTNGSNDDAVRQFARKMKSVAQQTIIDEQRPGGSLWRMRQPT